MNLSIIFLLFTIALMAAPGKVFSQKNDQIAERVLEIRMLYNDAVSKTETFEKRIFVGSQVVYLNEGQIVRAKTESDDGKKYDFFYDDKEGLFFAFSVDANKVEDRYYFTNEEYGLLDIEIPLLIKWLNGKKKIDPLDRRFIEQNIEVIQASMAVKNEARQFLALGELPYLELKKATERLQHKAEKIDLLDKSLIEFTDLLKDDEENVFCEEGIRTFSAQGKTNIIYQVYNESCDPGCMVITGSKESKYYDDDGKQFLKIVDNLTSAYSEEAILFNTNNVEIIERVYIFYDQEIEIYRRNSLKINDYLIY